MSTLREIDFRAAHAWPALRGFVALAEGAIVVDEASGIRLRVGTGGHLDEILAGGHPHPGISSDPAAGRVYAASRWGR